MFRNLKELRLRPIIKLIDLDLRVALITHRLFMKNQALNIFILDIEMLSYIN